MDRVRPGQNCALWWGGSGRHWYLCLETSFLQIWLRWSCDEVLITLRGRPGVAERRTHFDGAGFGPPVAYRLRQQPLLQVYRPCGGHYIWVSMQIEVFEFSDNCQEEARILREKEEQEALENPDWLVADLMIFQCYIPWLLTWILCN